MLIVSLWLCVTVVGLTDGSVRVLDSITLQDEITEPFKLASQPITKIVFSHDSQFFATAVSGFLL